MTNQQKDQPTGKSVLLFSGGMDSLIMADLLRPDVLLYVRHGARYQQAELAALAGLAPRLHTGVTFADVPLGRWERPDAIVPLRNLFFVALAALHGELVLVGAMDGDRSLDKSPEFMRQASALLTYLYGEQHWCVARGVAVEAPYKSKTKTELVGLYLRHGGDPRLLLESLSCYEPAGGRACGQCKPCFRKWVALANNGVLPVGGEWETYFDAPPWLALWLPAVWPAVWGGTYRGREDADWARAMRESGHGL